MTILKQSIEKWGIILTEEACSLDSMHLVKISISSRSDRRYPWEPSSGTAGMTKELLHLRVHRSLAELRRCKEELVYLPGDSSKAQRFLLYQVRLLANLLASHLQSRLHDEKERSLQIGNIFAITLKLKQHLAISANVHAKCATI